MKRGKCEAVGIDIVCPTALSVLEHGSSSLSFAISTPEIECAHHFCPTILLLFLRLKNTEVSKCDTEEWLFPSPNTFVLGNQEYEAERKEHPLHVQDLHLAFCLVLKLQAEERLHQGQAQHVVKAVTCCPGKLLILLFATKFLCGAGQIFETYLVRSDDWLGAPCIMHVWVEISCLTWRSAEFSQQKLR